METIVITGASRGIGAASAEHLAVGRRRLVLVSRSASSLEALCARLPVESIPLPIDLSAEDAGPSLLKSLKDRGLEPDGWVLNAGMSNDVAFTASDAAAVRRELQLNYLTPLSILEAEVRRMRVLGSGRVVTVGSLTSFVPFPGNATYAASKAALFTLVRSLRAELDGSGVKLGVVLPGYTRTAMTNGLSKSWVPSMSADEVGRHVAQAYERGDALVVPGLANRIAARIFGGFPKTSDWMLTRFASLVVPKADA
ncbi:MAG: SDR family NAD(P)-dependent oxidoreductase [Myxococcota bacterium]